MDERLKKRILLFQIAGVINVILGLYVLIAGRGFLDAGTQNVMVLFFFAFAGVDFYFPRAIRKKWEQDQAQARQMQQK